MSVLSQLISRIPGLDDYNDQVRQNVAQTNAGVQQASGLMGIVNQMRAQDRAAREEQEGQQLREIVRQAGGDPRKAVEALISTGTPQGISLAEKLKGLLPKPAEPRPIGTGLLMPDGAIVAPPEKPPSPTDVARLIAERDALPPEHPNRAHYDSALTKKTETPERFSNLQRLLREKAALPPGDPAHATYANAIRKESETARQIVPPIVVNGAGRPPPHFRFKNDGSGDLEPIPGGLHDRGGSMPAPAIGETPATEVAPVAAAADNLDARDLRARGPAPAAATPAPVAPAAPAMPQFVGNAAEQTRARNKWIFDEAKRKALDAKAAASPNASKDAIESDAWRYITDGTLPPNMGRGAQGAEQATQIRNRAAEIAKEIGVKPEELRAAQLTNKAQVAAIGQLGRARAQIMQAEKLAMYNADLALKASEEAERSGVPLLNRGVQWAQENLTGNVQLRKFTIANETFISEYAKVMGGGYGAAAPTEGAQRRAHALLNRAATKEEYVAAIDQLKAEMKNRGKSLDDQMAEERARLFGGSRRPGESTGSGPGGKPSANQFFK